MKASTTSLVGLAMALHFPPTSLSAVTLPSGAEIPVSTGSSSLNQGPLVAVFPDGGFIVVWTAGPLVDGKTEIHAREFAADGSPETGELQLIPPATTSQTADAVAADRDGTFLLAWEEGSARLGAPVQVYVRRLSRHGAILGRRLRVHARSPNSRQGGRLAIHRDGRFAVAWASFEIGPPANAFVFSNTVARTFLASGAPAGPEFVVDQGEPGIGDNALDFAPTGMVWNPDGTLTIASGGFATDVGHSAFLHLLTIRGRARQPRIDLNPRAGTCQESSAALQSTPAGDLVVAWQGYECDDFAIQAQRFSGTLASLGPRARVSKRLAGVQASPAVAVQPDGGYVVVWDDTQGWDGDGGGIFGRAFAADGTPLSRDFLVNVSTAGNQQDPAIAATPDGGAVVVWNGPDAQSTSPAVFARLLRPR
jgi:hypothetical protein